MPWYKLNYRYDRMSSRTCEAKYIYSEYELDEREKENIWEEYTPDPYSDFRGECELMEALPPDARDKMISDYYGHIDYYLDMIKLLKQA